MYEEMNVPYNVLYALAETAHRIADEEYLQDEIQTVANTYGVSFKELYMRVRKLYMHEFA